MADFESLTREAVTVPSERALLARIEALEAAVRARDELLAITAHELRNPMHALLLQLTAAEVAARKSGDPELIQRIARTKSITDRFIKRASLILEVSRLRADKGALTLEEIDLRTLVLEARESYMAEAMFHRIDSIDVRAEGHCVGRWDRLAVEQIISNLLSNAIKYGAGAVISMEVKRTHEPDGVQLEVKDRGVGIAPEDLPRIFERFEQVLSGQRRREGFGLGLWLVKRLVEGHGGTLTATSEIGAGSTFSVWLPCEPPVEERAR
jgi:two-component system, OmpR family, sensor kinase